MEMCKILSVFVVVNLSFVLQLQHFHLCNGDDLEWTSNVEFGFNINEISLEVELESSAVASLVQGGHLVNFNVSISYRRDKVGNESYTELENAFESYCQYVDERMNKDFYTGGDTVLNCTNITRTMETNHTCNSSDGINCVYNLTNLTANLTEFSGNLSNQSEAGNITLYSLIVKKVQHNITSLNCVNITTPLVKFKPIIHPPSHFNLSYENMEIEIELPSEFNIDSIEDLMLANRFDNVTLNCTQFVVNSSYNRHSGKPKIIFQVQFSNISWNGTLVITASVSERVVPRQLLNVTGNVTFAGITKPLWIGSYTVPGLWYKDMTMKTTNFDQTPGKLLTDEEEVVMETSFVVPSVTTDIEVFIKFPVFAGSIIPLKIISALVLSMQGNIQSSNLHSGSSIGSKIVLEEVVTLDPSAPTLVKFNFGKTVNRPGLINSSIILQVTGRVDSTGRNEGYIPNSHGNITSWLIHSTASGKENVTCPQWVELELGQPQIKHETSFVKHSSKVEGGDEIECSFKFFNPAFATEAADVVLNVVFASQGLKLNNFTVTVCNITLDSSAWSHCQNANASSLLNLTITNTTSSFHIQITNLTVGFGIFGKVVGIVLTSVSASEVLRNQVDIKYDRQRWAPVTYKTTLIATVKPIVISPAVIVSSSVDSTSKTTPTIGEKVTFKISTTIPVTTNEKFAVVIGQSSISYDKTTLIHVGDNLLGRELTIGTKLNVTSGFIPEAANTYTYSVLVGQFGAVRNTGNTLISDAAMFTLQVPFFVKNIASNYNNRLIKVTTTVFHHPNQMYKSDTDIQIVEPGVVASFVASPSKDVQQNSEISFTATLRHTSTSKSDAFNLLVQLAVPSPHLKLTTMVTPKSGTITIVPGNLVPRPFPSPEIINSTVIVYKTDVFQHNSEAIEIKYKATSSSTLPACVFITSPIVLFYTSLPKTLNQSLAREYSFAPRSEASFLTFRPDPFLTLTFTSENKGEFDSGDILNFTLVVKNVGVGNVEPTAYSVMVTISLSKTPFKDPTIVCDQGAFTTISTVSLYTLKVEKTPFDFNEELKCNVTTTVNTVVPSQTIELQANLIYHCLPTNFQYHYGSYSMNDKTGIHIKPLSMELYTVSGGIPQVLTGEILQFDVKITLPEVTTALKVEYRIPTISSDARGKRSTRQKRATQMEVLNPISSQTTYSNGGNLVPSALKISKSSNTYIVEFATISNTPDNVESSKDVLVIKANFSVANQPLILSGRNFEIVSSVSFPGGTLTQTVKFAIVGPLLKPLLQLVKSFQVIDTSLDSPSGIFYVNISHSPGSLYDAYDINVSDAIEGMNVIRDKEFKGIVISAPTNNKYKFSCNIPLISVGQTTHFYYKAQFKVNTKIPKYLQIPASLTWRSPQLNSPVYGPEINSDACVARNDTIKEKHEPLYGFLALGAFLGFVVGFILFIIAVCIFVKCCNKGRLVPYYRVFSGKTTYTALEEESEDKPYATTTTTNNTSLQQTESVIYIIATDDPKKSEKQLENLDIQATKRLDRNLQRNRQKMFVSAFNRVVGNLRKKREISEEQSKLFTTKLQEGLEDINARNSREFKKRTADLKKKMQAKGEAEMKQLDERKMKEIEEAKKKLDGADKKKTIEVLNMIVNYFKSLEHDVQLTVQLQHDIEQEQIKKELSVNDRITSKELQTKLVKELAADAELSNEDAQKLIAEHLEAIAAAEKIHDDEKSRQIMALEMRLAERKALAQEIREQQQQEDEILSSMKEKYENVLKNLVNSSQMTEAEATAYREKLLKDVENLNKKLSKQRIRQEENLHERLTILKKQKLQEKEKEHQLELKKLGETRENTEDPTDFITAHQKFTQKHNEEILDLERELDRNAAQDLKDLRAQFAEEARREYKVKMEKQYGELIKKGVLEANLADLLSAHDRDVARIVEAQQAQETKQKQALEEKLMKRREILTEKMKAEQKEQEKIRNEEQKVLEKMIDNQVAISEDEKERILREHQKNMAELESSLTLNKLRQKQMLEQKLEQRRAVKLNRLQQKHENEHKRIKIENIDGTTEEIDLLKKQEMERLELMRNDSRMENEIEQIRDEMLKARMEALEEHNDRLGALIAELHIQRANQIAEINKQQRALGQLQTSILHDLDEKGVLVDPETKEILQRHQDQTQQLESVLKTQREQQEQALKDRLQEKLKQKEMVLIQEQKDEIAKYLDGMEASSGITRFRKTALKARHKSQLDHAKQQIEKEVEQSINEMKLQLEVNRLKAIEKQSIQFIAALVKCGRIQEDELDSVLQVLFPTKKPEEIDELLAQIYGPNHTNSSSISLKSSKPSSLEMKVIAQISPLPANRRKSKPRFEKPERLDDLPPPEAAGNLPPVILQGSKGFNLQNTLRKEDSKSKMNPTSLGRVRLAPLEK